MSAEAAVAALGHMTALAAAFVESGHGKCASVSGLSKPTTSYGNWN
jgi:hypothetical protein